MIIAVASNGQGASTLAYDMARQCAEKAKTLLIDFETLHPDITIFLDQERSADFGIDAVFRRQDDITPRSIDGSTFVTKQNFFFLPGTRNPNRLDISDKKVRDLLQAADKFADVVIVDCPDRMDVVTGLHTFSQAERILRVRHHTQAWKMKLREEELSERILFERFNLAEKVEDVWIGNPEGVKPTWILPDIPDIEFEDIPRDYSAAVRRMIANIVGEEELKRGGWFTRWRESLKLPLIGR